MEEIMINQETINRSLVIKGATKPCSRCGGKKFAVVNGHSNFVVNHEKDLINIQSAGESIPVIFVICNKCGAITPHAIYGLVDRSSLDLEEGKNNDKK